MSTHLLTALENIRATQKEYKNLIRDKENNHGSTPGQLKYKVELLKRAERILQDIVKPKRQKGAGQPTYATGGVLPKEPPNGEVPVLLERGRFVPETQIPLVADLPKVPK